ncbi:MAG TPA: hypothetical protein VFR85_00475 [Anaeromyxobacteraceae bacterium]|nr:hypothetical protein [Anaeromyxobacteraceae bacterium]
MLLAAVGPFLPGSDGCTTTEYELDLRPEGSVLHRRLVVRRYQMKSGQRVPRVPMPEDLARIGALYPTPPAGAPVSPSFVGTFDRETPPDIGGGGRLLQLRTTLGTTWSYIERFGEAEDPAAALARTRRAIGEVTAALAGWLQYELRGHPARLRISEIEARVRTDLESVLLYAWAARSSRMERGARAGDEPGEPTRMGLFLVERGYVEAEELPRLVRAIRSGEADGRAASLMAFVQQWLSRELGCAPGDPLPAELDVLGDARRARDALEAYLRHRAKLEALASPVAPDGHRPGEPDGPIHELASNMDAILFDSGGSRASIGVLGSLLGRVREETVTVRLQLPTLPFATNGAWSARASAVEWKALPIVGMTLLPTVVYAHWSVPDAPYQRARFGRVALRGEPLAEYALWRAGLAAGDGERWDAMMDGLRPGTDLAHRLDTLRLGGGPTSDGDASDLAGPARDLLRSALAPTAPPKLLRPRPGTVDRRRPPDPREGVGARNQSP